jgi:hypothetical protein
MRGQHGSIAEDIVVCGTSRVERVRLGRQEELMTTSATKRWYFWLIAAAVLFVIGIGALVVLGDGLTESGQEDTSLVSGLAWLVWLLSWIGAVVSAVIGIGLGIGQARSGSGAPADS